jgi:energy-coupling factor transporter ATP-binding protein EcfA2
MKQLERMVLVQFFVCDAEELSFSGHTALLGPNGTGKTALLDAIQIVMLGADSNRIKFNAKKSGTSDRRDIRDYCLGYFKPRDDTDGAGTGAQIARRKRDTSLTYISLVFRDGETDEAVSAGVCLSASAQESKHRINGLYVARGVDLRLADHVESQGEDMWPLSWKEFEARLRRLASAKGTTPVIEDRSEKFVGELLHVLQPRGVSINPVEYQKAFKKSLLLNQIDNVSDFVRDFVIDEEPIDRTRAMAQIHEFRRLQILIEDLQDRIDRLAVLQRQFLAVEREHRKMSSLEGLVAVYQVEEAAGRASALEDQLAEAERELRRTKDKLASLEPALLAAQLDVDRVTQALMQDPAAQELQDKQSLLEERQRFQSERLISLQRQVNQIRAALNASGDFISETARASVLDADQQLTTASERANQNGFGALGEAVKHALRTVSAMGEPIRTEWLRAQQDHEQAKQEYQALSGSAANQRDGGAALPRGPGQAVDVLREAGIQARPVCDLIEITDSDWQCAIETYLARNRFALLVPSGKEDEAVRIIRRPGKRIAGVKIVQPQHLKDRIGRRPEAWSVAALVTGANEQAVAYIHGILGRIRRVSTEQELREHSQALTVDGLLSKSGGTETLELLSYDQLVIGRRGAAPDEAALLRQLDAAGTKVSKLHSREKALEAARDRIVQLGGSDEVLGNVERLVREAETGQQAVISQQRLVEGISTAHLEVLKTELATQVARRDKLHGEQREADARLGASAAHIDATEASLTTTWQDLEKAKVAEAAKRKDPDFDGQLVDELRSRIDVDPAGRERDYPVRLELCQTQLGEARTAATRAANRALPEFGTFVDRYTYPVVEERSDWRKAMVWMELTKQQIIDTKLHEYQPQADMARQVAEKSFRQDVVFKLREGIARMKHNIGTLNQILETCPPFSHNETYKFIFPLAEEHKKLHDYIIWTGNDDASDALFGDDSDLSKQIVAMLSPQPVEGGKPGKNPLEDFRLMFNFDLQIRENGVPFSTLSKRMQSSSNGEHLTPFYVVAAAALTHAYRMDQGEGREGAALMLLDEAFAAMDDQNAVATAKFIDGLGLQMIMGAPSADSAKLSSFTDTLYELVREGEIMEFHREELTAAGHALLRSDMPSEHPQLVAARLKRGPDASLGA